MTLISEYNPAWPSWFLQISDLVAEKLGPTCLAIEHVGSTAVPGMTAKPIIDMIVVIECSMFQTVKARLAELGYHHQGDLSIPGREAFKLGNPGMSARLPPHHLYVCPRESEKLKRQVAFRDHLRANPEWVVRLSDRKQAAVPGPTGRFAPTATRTSSRSGLVSIGSLDRERAARCVSPGRTSSSSCPTITPRTR